MIGSIKQNNAGPDTEDDLSCIEYIKCKQCSLNQKKKKKFKKISIESPFLVEEMKSRQSHAAVHRHHTICSLLHGTGPSGSLTGVISGDINPEAAQ